MERLKLVQGLSYSYGDMVATKAHPFVEVEDTAVADYLVQTGFFVPIDFDSSSAKGVPAHETKKGDPEDTVGMPSPVKAPAKKASPLDTMTVEELRKYADIQGIPLGTAKQKKSILKVIREAEAKAAEALKALQES